MRVAPVSNHADRRARLVDRLATESLTSLIVTSQPNIAYLTGFFGTAGLLLVTGEQLLLIVDGRYTETAEQRRRDWEAINIVTLSPGGSYEESLADHVERSGGRRRLRICRPHRRGPCRSVAPASCEESRSRPCLDRWDCRTLACSEGRLGDCHPSGRRVPSLRGS